MSTAGAVGDDEPARRIERMMSEATGPVLDYYRDVRDAMSEAAFFLTYGCLFSLYLADERAAEEHRWAAAAPGDPRDLPFVKDALASIEQGGYAESPRSHRRVIKRGDERIPLARLELRRDLDQDYAEFLPAMSRAEMRPIRGSKTSSCVTSPSAHWARCRSCSPPGRPAPAARPGRAPAR